MPTHPTYPGVYIEEIPSGVRTIVGVATSITGFIGRALRGPVDDPVTINSYGDFERTFGGLWRESKLGYAVRDFYLNGGSQAIVVRLYGKPAPAAAPAPAPAPPEKTPIDVDGLKLEAVEPGSAAGKYLRARLDVDIDKDVAENLDLKREKMFNLTVWDAGPGGRTERFLNLSVEDKALRRVDKVLKAESKLVHWKEDKWPSSEPGMPKLDEAWKKAIDVETKVKALVEAMKKEPPADVSAEKKAVDDARAELEKALKELEDPVTQAERSLAEYLSDNPTADEMDQDYLKCKEAVKQAQEKLNASDGEALKSDDFIGDGKATNKEGLYALEKSDILNLLCIPPYKATEDVDDTVVAAAAKYCEDRRAILLVDPPSKWTTKKDAKDCISGLGTRSKNAAVFFPRLKQPDPLSEGRMNDFVPCGAVAGIFARTDVQRGVWKAPAGLEATLVGVPQLSVPLTDAENGELNPLGINCLRTMPAAGAVVWGSRTLQGADRLASEWKYIPVRRTALFIEESLYRGTQWVVFEPNDEPLWAQIRLNIGAFMHNLFRQGAFQGKTPREAYFVKCDKETTTQTDINLGIVNIIVGFAPLKPAEFVIIKLQQIAGQIEV